MPFGSPHPAMSTHCSRRSFASTIVFLALFILPSYSSAEWKEKVLYSFQGGTDGALPVGSIVFDKAGNIYGATTDGGGVNCNSPTQCGTVYQLSPPIKQGDPWTETVLYVFKGAAQGDGATPTGGLLIDGQGNLYGATGYGGAGVCNLLGGNVGCGTVYELSPPKIKGGQWIEKVLYSFQGNKDGQLPWQDLTFDRKGNLYGVTYYGGGYGDCNKFYGYCGTVFKLSRPQGKGKEWREQVLYRFKGIASGKTSGDGGNPNGGLTFDRSGAIYGTTANGGYSGGGCAGNEGFNGCGVTFRLRPRPNASSQWSRELLCVFKAATDGSAPNGGVILDRNGDLFGTTQGGGTDESGVVY